MAPDLTWVRNEIDYRRQNLRWCDWIDTVQEHRVIAYRLAHSALVVVPLCIAMQWWWFLLGWCIHVIMDLPTHSGRMQQQPLYPIKWRWPWLLKSYY